MIREQVFSLIRAHLADELELRSRQDPGVDPLQGGPGGGLLDLYTLVQELEDSYGVKISDEEAAKILTVGQAVDFVLASGAAEGDGQRQAAASQSPETE